MSNKFLTLLKYESTVLRKTHQIHTNLLWIFLICNLATPIILEQSMRTLCPPLFIIVYLPVMLIISYSSMITKDFNDGSLDFLLSTYNTYEILFAKLGSLFLFSFTALVLYVPILIFFFSLNLLEALILLFCGTVICLQTSSLALLVATIQKYFQKPLSVLSSLLLSFLISLMMLCGLLCHNPQIGFIYIILGVVVLNLAVALGMANYLICNL